MSRTRVERVIRAAPAAIYRALLDAADVARWRVPDGMTSTIHAWEPREGGHLRVSLTYDAPDAQGKTSAHTDTYHGRFVRLVPDREVVEADTFETDDPSMQGEMVSTITLHATEDGATRVVATHDDLPAGLSAADNEEGWRLAFEKLAALVESR